MGLTLTRKQQKLRQQNLKTVDFEKGFASGTFATKSYERSKRSTSNIFRRFQALAARFLSVGVFLCRGVFWEITNS